MFLFRLGLRNLLRNRRRSLLSLGSIVAGIAVFVLGQGLVSGMRENVIRAQIDTVSGHLQTQPRGYPTDGRSHPLEHLVPITTEARAWLDAHATAWTRRVLFSCDGISHGDALRLRGIGFDPATDGAVFPRKDWSVAGAIPARAEDGVLLARGPAKLLELGPGDWITVRVRTAQGAVNALELPIAGVVSTGSPMLDYTAILLPWELSDRLVRHGDEVSHVAVRLPDRDDVEAAGAELAALLDSEYVTWRSETTGLMRIMDIRQQVLNFLSFILLAMAAAGIANTVLMAAYERVREIGTLQALGMNRSDVVRLFLWEGAVLGLLGGALGAALGGGLVYRWSTVGLDMSDLIDSAGAGDTYGALPMSVMLYTEFRPDVLALGLGAGVLVALLASVYPAVVASRMNPADAVRA